MKNIVIYDIKGGTGKTTTAKTLAVGFANLGKRVCLQDLDPQGNTGKSYTCSEVDLSLVDYAEKSANRKEEIFCNKFLNQSSTKTMCDLFDDPRLVHELIRSTDNPYIDVIPSNLRLSLIDTKLRLSNGRQENFLKRASNYINREYDYGIIDCSPVKSLLTVNALYAANLVIIPLSVDDDAMQGLALTLREIRTMKEMYEEINFDYRILITMKNKTRIHDMNLRYLREVFGNKVLQTVICYQSNPVALATSKRKTVLELKETHISRDYLALVYELEELL